MSNLVQAMAEVLRKHQPTTGMSVASGVTCQCGYWTGDEQPGVTRPPGFSGLTWHQAQEVDATIFGRIRDNSPEPMASDAERYNQRGCYTEGDS
jgi:hypothetical protein